MQIQAYCISDTDTRYRCQSVLARDAQAKLALIVAQIYLSVHPSVCPSACLSATACHAYVRSIARREPPRLPACLDTRCEIHVSYLSYVSRYLYFRYHPALAVVHGDTNVA